MIMLDLMPPLQQLPRQTWPTFYGNGLENERTFALPPRGQLKKKLSSPNVKENPPKGHKQNWEILGTNKTYYLNGGNLYKPYAPVRRKSVELENDFTDQFEIFTAFSSPPEDQGIFFRTR